MRGFLGFISSSIGRKLLMSFTGMAMALFLLAHVIGNLLVLVSYEKYNEYSYALTSNKLLLYSAEVGLIAVLLIHIYMAIVLTRQNSQARPNPYLSRRSTGRSRRFWGSSNMGITGTLILIFVGYHLWHFKFGAQYATTQNGTEMRDLARLVIEEFKEPVEVILYLVAMIIVYIHLLHGFRSAFDTLGMATGKWDRWLLNLSRVFVVGVMGGFILIPLWIYFFVGV